MNILISTTLGWNPGDSWIMYGCQNIIREALPAQTQINWIYYNRNVDLMTHQNGYANLRRTKGNYYTTEIPYPLVDLFVQAGSPEWHGPPAKSFHEAVLASDAPYIIMGAGATGDHIPLTELDVQVLMRPNTYIYTRAKETANRINEILGVEKAEALPCPAVCASLVTYDKKELTAQVPQTDFGHQRVKSSYLEGLSKDMPVIAELTSEWEHYTEQGYKVRYAGSAAATLQTIGRFKKILTTRLHAAIVGYGLGCEVVLVGKGDYRIETAARPFRIPVVENFAEAQKTGGALDFDLKWNTFNQYKQRIEEVLR